MHPSAFRAALPRISYRAACRLPLAVNQCAASNRATCGSGYTYGDNGEAGARAGAARAKSPDGAARAKSPDEYEYEYQYEDEVKVDRKTA